MSNEVFMAREISYNEMLLAEKDGVITALRAENERLRVALREIIRLDDEWVPETQDDYSYGGYIACANIARAALTAGLAAWPGMECRPTFTPSRIILPLTQKPCT